MWILQENWYCLLAYFIAIATMILRVFETNQETNDRISFAMYWVILVAWLIIVSTKRLIGVQADRFLIAFNHHTSSIIIVSPLVFYMAVCFCSCKIVWIAIIVIFWLYVHGLYGCGINEK